MIIMPLNMNRMKYLINLSCGLLLILAFTSCSVNLGYFYKKLAIDKTIGRIDLGKVLFELETKDYNLVIRENRTTYCPRSVSYKNINLDTINQTNKRLDELINILLDKNKIVTRFTNLRYNPKLDLMFISKGEMNKNEILDTLLNHMENIFCFDIKKEEIKYDLRIVDSIKYTKMLSNKKGKGSLSYSRSKIVLINKDLNSIKHLINYNYDVFVDYDNSNKYSMVLKGNSIENLKSNLLDNYGIALTTSPLDDKFVKIEFMRNQN